MSVYKKLIEVQTKLKAPKNQYNSFGKYSYRNCEDILEALKPILREVGATIIISDEVVSVNERYYVKATVKFIDTETGEVVEASANAREEDNKKGRYNIHNDYRDTYVKEDTAHIKLFTPDYFYSQKILRDNYQAIIKLYKHIFNDSKLM